MAVGVARCLLQGQFPFGMQILIGGAGGGANAEGGGLGVNQREGRYWTVPQSQPCGQ